MEFWKKSDVNEAELSAVIPEKIVLGKRNYFRSEILPQ